MEGSDALVLVMFGILARGLNFLTNLPNAFTVFWLVGSSCMYPINLFLLPLYSAQSKFTGTSCSLIFMLVKTGPE